MAMKKSTYVSTQQAPKATAAEPLAPTAPKAPNAPNARTRRDKSMEPTAIEDLPTEEIWAHYRNARKAKDAAQVEHIRNVLMERHYPLVRYIAERLLQTLPKSIELDDLVSAGLFGLMDAIRGFEPERGIKFKTYCTTRIRGSILDQLRSQDWVPRLVRLKASKIERALQRLIGQFGREPTHAELAAELELEHGELSLEIASASAKSMYSLSDKWEDRDEDGSMEKVDVLEDRKSVDPIGELNREDMMTFICRSLTGKERFIIEQYYQVGHTMREIGEMLNLTESRVCQIHSNVMLRLKSLFNAKQNTLLM
jgi:RNA polymerase sigma factor for flagellar operon FliA